MRFRMLGPLEVWDGEQWCGIRAAQQRTVLAVLLAEAGHPVTTDRLIDEIWPDRAPPAAVGTIQGYVMRLRRLIGGGAEGPLRTYGRGYVLRVEPGDLDTGEFDRLVAAGRHSRAEGQLVAAVAQLSEALALWRGPALADVPQTRTVVAEVARLEQARLTALEQRLAAQLAAGQHAEVVDELHRLVGEQPLREQLWAQLMVALYRCGRRAEALEAYQRARRALIDEIGLEPSQPVRELQQAILADDPGLAVESGPPSAAGRGPVVPAQLPPDVPHFTGRAEQLRALDGLLHQSGGLILCVVTGPGGAGKTATVLHWAHRVADRFPDGQLYVDLRSNTAHPPLRPIEALARFLRALGVAAREVPAEEDEAATLYRSLLAGKRVLVVLDNAHHPDQVRPLLPGGSRCAVVVTSRDQLGGLVARDGAVRQPLGMLAPAEAEGLIIDLLGTPAAVDRPAVGDLARLCGYLPLALRIAVANLVTVPPDGTGPAAVADLVKRLAMGDRLAALQVDGDPQAAVRVTFDHSYARQPPPARRLFRLLGLVPGPHATVDCAAALAAVPATQAARLLRQLTGAHLVEERPAGRYALHDLLREYAAEQAGGEDSDADRAAALHRLADRYLRGVLASADLLYPEILRLPPPPPAPDDPGVVFATHQEAAAWLRAQRPNLVAMVRHAAIRELAAAYQLADAMRGYLYASLHTVDWRLVADAALAAATAAGEPRARAAAHLSLAQLAWVQGRHEDAIGHHHEALALARSAGWADGVCAALGNLGNLHWALGRLDEAARHYQEVIEVSRRGGQHAVTATAMGNLGLVHYQQGRLDLAIGLYVQALEAQQHAGSPGGRARILLRLGEVYHRAGRFDQARSALRQAVDLQEETGDRIVAGDALRTLAAVERDAGQLAAAQAAVASAGELAGRTGDQRLQAGVLTTRASILARQGRAAEAIEGHRRAAELAGAIGNRYVLAEALVGLADGHRRARAFDAAVEVGLRGLVLARSDGYRVLEGESLAVLAAVHRDSGGTAAAAEYRWQAAEVRAELDGYAAQAHSVLLQPESGKLPPGIVSR